MNVSISNNTTLSETDSCIIHTDSGMYIVYITVFISIVSICECLVVILVTVFSENLYGNTNILVASLAISELLLAIGFIGNQLSTVQLCVSYVLKSKLIKCVIYGLCSATGACSNMHMLVIAIDRYIQIAHPFYYIKKMTKTRTHFILLGVWIMCAIFFIIPPTVYYGDQYHRQCILLHQPKVYNAVSVSAYFISLIVVFICYFRIAHVAFKRKQSANARRLRYNISQADIEHNDTVKEALKRVKFFALMFGVLFVCTFPSSLATELSFIFRIPENVYLGLFSLFPIHTAINFLIYAYMNTEFSTAIVKNMVALKSRCCKDRRQM